MSSIKFFNSANFGGSRAVHTVMQGTRPARVVNKVSAEKIVVIHGREHDELHREMGTNQVVYALRSRCIVDG